MGLVDYIRRLEVIAVEAAEKKVAAGGIRARVHHREGTMAKQRAEGWLEIMQYWEFFDFPRYVLARDGDGRYWIFDGAFDDDADEYRPDFTMACVGYDLDEALVKFETRSAIPRDADRSGYESVSLRKVKFDKSSRARIHIEPF